MSHIFNRIRDLDESNSETVKETISAFIQNILITTGESNVCWLTTLEDIINRFPKYCFSHRTKIEKYLAKFLDSRNSQDVIAAAKCAHLLQQVRPSYEKTATPKSRWRDQMILLCDTVHLLIDATCSNAVDTNKQSDGKESSDSSDMSDSPLTLALDEICSYLAKDGDVKDKLDMLSVRLRNVFIFIQAMLVEAYPAVKTVCPRIIIDAICQTMSKPRSDTVSITLNVYSLKIEALRSLEALILCVRSNLLPLSPLIFRVVIRTLHWNINNDDEESVKLRIQSYATLKCWLTTLHCGSVWSASTQAKGKCPSEQLVDHIVRDITPKTRPVILTMNAQPSKNLSKKAKRKLANTQLKESSLSAHMPGAGSKTEKADPTSSEDLAVVALECLETFLLVTGIFLKPNTHKVIQSTLVRECHRLQEYSGRRALRLCRALDASRKCVASNTPPPTQHCLLIFSQLVTCHDPELSSFCSNALLDIRLHLHCSPPSLNFVLPETVEKEATPNTKNVVSEKNRAALESLLGADRMPNATPPEEIITILDEPTNKKPRLEENISISSQSSIEIDDDDDDIEEVQEIILDEPDSIVEDGNQPEQGDDLAELGDEPIIIEFENTTVGSKDSATSKIKILQVETITPNLHDLHTQLPANLSNDLIDGQESSHSLEIDYDYPNSVKNTVTVLEKLDDENLPSTNETDDIQITCGQLLKSSQDVLQKKVYETKENVSKITNGDVEEVVTINNGELAPNVTNGNLSTNGAIDCKNNVTESNIAKNAGDVMSVDDMLADFVDEVNE